jgi:branched-subunit amino acid aminotransferase/4-amino-4-deoxychorismate lyase
MKNSFPESQSYLNGRWVPLQTLAWSVTDLGTTQGAMLVERLRTYGGKLFDVQEHLARLADGAEKLGIPWPLPDLAMEDLCRELVDRNQELIAQEQDCGLVLLLSPGDPGVDRSRTLVPTLMAHLTPIPFAQLSRWYRDGVALHISSVRNVPTECWSPSIKTRSRLQYYLADHRDIDLAKSRSQPGAPPPTPARPSVESIAVLLNIHGCVTETSISNLLVLGKDGVLRSPPLKDILWGVSLKTVCRLAESIGQPIAFSDIQPDALLEAKEILMTGTTGGVWAAISVDGNRVGEGRPGPLCHLLQEAWQKKLGIHFIELASRKTN